MKAKLKRIIKEELTKDLKMVDSDPTISTSSLDDGMGSNETAHDEIKVQLDQGEFTLKVATGPQTGAPSLLLDPTGKEVLQLVTPEDTDGVGPASKYTTPNGELVHTVNSYGDWQVDMQKAVDKISTLRENRTMRTKLKRIIKEELTKYLKENKPAPRQIQLDQGVYTLVYDEPIEGMQTVLDTAGKPIMLRQPTEMYWEPISYTTMDEKYRVHVGRDEIMDADLQGAVNAFAAGSDEWEYRESGYW